ncbi:MAG: PEP-CTERM sorting domain-containing protein [Planctomycetes bacterium]|nr:PEP-CTERM sorting domain-containing protein [Planctomycetota bacterium]
MRCNRFSTGLILAVVTALALATSAGAATLTVGTTAPVVDGEDIANLAAGTAGEKLWTDTRAIGQTFTTGSQDAVLDAITLQSWSGSLLTKNYTLTIGDVSGTSYSAFATESGIVQSVDSVASDYWTFTLDTPVTLSANTLYGFDLAMNSSTSGWQSGIPYRASTANSAYTDGQAYRSQTNGQSTPTFGYINADKVFHLNMEAASGGDPEPLLVDFNSTNQDGGPHNQAGFLPYDAAHEVAADFDTKTYSAFGTTVSVTPDWPNSTDNRVQQMIDRGSGNDANWDNAAGDLDLVTDFLGTDTRTGNGGNGNWDGTTGTPTYLTLALGDLPAGGYDWKSFHHDTENVHGDFTVDISTDGGATWEALPDGLMTDSTPAGNPDSSGFDPVGPWTGPDANTLPSTFQTSFLADGTNDVVLRFAPLSNTAVHRQIWGINGFELTQASAVPEPSTFALAALGLLGLAWYGRRRRRS